MNGNALNWTKRHPQGWNEMPPPEVRSVEDALAMAERHRLDHRIIVCVYAYDWDIVLLADEVKRLRASNKMLWDANRKGHKVTRT